MPLLTLTWSERRALQETLRSARDETHRLRVQLLLDIASGTPVARASAALGIPIGAAYAWLKEYVARRPDFAATTEPGRHVTDPSLRALEEMAFGVHSPDRRVRPVHRPPARSGPAQPGPSESSRSWNV